MSSGGEGAGQVGRPDQEEVRRGPDDHLRDLEGDDGHDAGADEAEHELRSCTSATSAGQKAA